MAIPGPHLLPQHALEEQGVLAGTMRDLVQAFDDQQSRLDRLRMLALRSVDSRAGQHPTPTVCNASVSSTVVRCFGSLDISAGACRLVNWRSGKARALFEYLVTHRGRPTPRETLIQALWPDPDAVAAGTSLKVAVHTLRQILAELSTTGTAPITILVRESSYELKASGMWVDTEEFESACRAGARLWESGDTCSAIDSYIRAADLYRGDFLADTWDDWVVLRREGLKDQYLFVLARLADAAMRAGEYERCAEYARRLLDEDDCREDSYRMLMICHARLGQPGRVRRWHELCVRTMRAVLETDPDPETERVFRWASTSSLHGRDAGPEG